MSPVDPTGWDQWFLNLWALLFPFALVVACIGWVIDKLRK